MSYYNSNTKISRISRPIIFWSIILESVNLLNELFEKKQYVKFIENFERYSKEIIDIENNEDLKKQATISYFKNKDFDKAIAYIEKVKKETLERDYLLCEIYAECLSEKFIFLEAYSYFDKALKLNPQLKNVRINRFLLGQLLGYSLDKKELNWCLEVLYRTKSVNRLRLLAHISYANRIFDIANLCFRSILTLGGQLNYIDYISYSAFGDVKLGTSNDAIIKQGSLDIFGKKIKSVTNSKKLVVSFAPNKNFVFRTYDFECNVLYITDLTSSYYMYSCNEIAEYIKSLVIKRNYNEISLIGGSKAGTGALLVYNILSQQLNVKINCVAFSPQVKIYPFNKNLKIPSYEQFSAVYSINPVAKYILSKIKQPKDLVVREGDKVTVIYGKNYIMDKSEALSININSGVDFLELDFSAHNTTIPFTIPENKTKEELRKKYEDLHTVEDADFQYLGGGKTIEVIDEIWNIYSDHKMRLRNFI